MKTLSSTGLRRSLHFSTRLTLTLLIAGLLATPLAARANPVPPSHDHTLTIHDRSVHIHREDIRAHRSR